MEHYLAHTDYPIWEVIQNGNGPVSITTDTQGQIKVLPPRTAEEIVARERERKARTTLLMALPEDHLAKFHKMTDAKEMWDAIKSRFEPREIKIVGGEMLGTLAIRMGEDLHMGQTQRHMTGNKANIAEYQDFIGGLVALVGSKGLHNWRLACLMQKATIDESNKWQRRKESNTRPPVRPNHRALLAIPYNFFHMEMFRPTSARSFKTIRLIASYHVITQQIENKANKHAGPPEANQNAGTKDIINAGDSEKEDESAQDYFVLPIWSSYSQQSRDQEQRMQVQHLTNILI
ncbi:hypothetical protein Tco_0072264 [Tanacetum coccineum]